MSQEFCDTRDPGLSTLDFGKTYSIVGIVNGPFDSAAFQTGVMVLRIPLITIAQTQIMIEIWNKNGGEKYILFKQFFRASSVGK